jgi:hypothetical protein
MPQSPPTVRAAAVVQAAEAAMVCAASVLAATDAAAGRSYQTDSGIALALIGFGTAVALGWVAVGLARARRWSRTPALLTQLFTGIVGIYLVEGHRYAWGVPALVAMTAGFVALLVPPSLRALSTGPPVDGGPQVDGGPPVDTGPPVDGGPPVDSGPAAPDGSTVPPGGPPGSAR